MELTQFAQAVERAEGAAQITVRRAEVRDRPLAAEAAPGVRRDLIGRLQHLVHSVFQQKREIARALADLVAGGEGGADDRFGVATNIAGTGVLQRFLGEIDEIDAGEFTGVEVDFFAAGLRGLFQHRRLTRTGDEPVSGALHPFVTRIRGDGDIATGLPDIVGISTARQLVEHGFAGLRQRGALGNQLLDGIGLDPVAGAQGADLRYTGALGGNGSSHIRGGQIDSGITRGIGSSRGCIGFGLCGSSSGDRHFFYSHRFTFRLDGGGRLRGARHRHFGNSRVLWGLAEPKFADVAGAGRSSRADSGDKALIERFLRVQPGFGIHHGADIVRRHAGAARIDGDQLRLHTVELIGGIA